MKCPNPRTSVPRSKNHEKKPFDKVLSEKMYLAAEQIVAPDLNKNA
jgi:hypothetical protein